jgi:hypothetical protein
MVNKYDDAASIRQHLDLQMPKASYVDVTTRLK